MIVYTSAQEGFTLKEMKNEDDYEFTITIQDVERFLPAMKQIQDHFEEVGPLTDVLFYVHQQHEFHIIVRRDYYVDFILSLCKYQFVDSVKWT